MLLIVASILALMFLNLVLGSVSIPLKSVWNIVCGLGDERVTWRLADADCFPESAGGSIRAGDQFRSEYGRGLCGAVER